MNDSKVNWQTTSSVPPQPSPDLMQIGKAPKANGCVPMVLVVLCLLALAPIVGAVLGFSVRVFHVTCGC